MPKYGNYECKVDVCGRLVGEHGARGYCSTHYKWARKRNFTVEPTYAIGRDKPIDTSGWSRENLAWCAGLIEGEGYFRLAEGKYPRIGVAVTDEDVLVKLKNKLGIGKVYGPIGGEKEHYKPIYRYRVGGKGHNKYAVLVAIYPWLCERRSKRAREVIRGWVKNG